MKILHTLIVAAIVAMPSWASDLTFTLNPSSETWSPGFLGVSVPYTGTLIDTGAGDLCDNGGAGCIYLNNVVLNFDPTDPAGIANFLTLDVGLFDNTLQNAPSGSALSDDGPNSMTGSGLFYMMADQPIFGIEVAPGTPQGIFTGNATIYGGVTYFGDPNGPGLNDPLASAKFTLAVVAPEPSPFGLAILGLGAVALVRRRVAA
jgi:MYXO-CTERM domain-containing protein